WCPRRIRGGEEHRASANLPACRPDRRAKPDTNRTQSLEWRATVNWRHHRNSRKTADSGIGFLKAFWAKTLYYHFGWLGLQSCRHQRRMLTGWAQFSRFWQAASTRFLPACLAK